VFLEAKWEDWFQLKFKTIIKKTKGAFVKTYTVDHQNYRIFKTGIGAKKQFVHFQWGKFDFRMSFIILTNIKQDNPEKTISDKKRQ